MPVTILADSQIPFWGSNGRCALGCEISITLAIKAIPSPINTMLHVSASGRYCTPIIGIRSSPIEGNSMEGLYSGVGDFFALDTYVSQRCTL
tara:strand:+ start:78 stop:353 length:276 start_codon:yes stop_codon:yes gene_type:complete